VRGQDQRDVAVLLVEPGALQRVEVQRAHPRPVAVREQPDREDAVHPQGRGGRAEPRVLPPGAEVGAVGDAGPGLAGGLHARALVEAVLHLVEPGGQGVGLDGGLVPADRVAHRDADEIGAGHDGARRVDDALQHPVHGRLAHERGRERDELRRQPPARVLVVAGDDGEEAPVRLPIVMDGH
jgi:hypothetical protein